MIPALIALAHIHKVHGLLLPLPQGVKQVERRAGSLGSHFNTIMFCLQLMTKSMKKMIMKKTETETVDLVRPSCLEKKNPSENHFLVQVLKSKSPGHFQIILFFPQSQDRTLSCKGHKEKERREHILKDKGDKNLSMMVKWLKEPWRKQMVGEVEADRELQ